jgi:hypothetical protein
MRRIQLPPASFFLPALASVGLFAGCSGEAGPPAAGTGTPGAGTATMPGASVPGTMDGTVTPGEGAGASADVTPAPNAMPGATSGEATTPADSEPGETTEGACTGTDIVASKRVVRLSFNQIANSIGTLIDPSLTPMLATENAILDSKHRAFPPLQSPREGSTITDGQWTTVDAMSSSAADYVLDNFEAVTGCGAQPTDACAQEYLSGLAEQAYRRPLTADEQTRLDGLYMTLTGDIGATINEAVQHGVYAILQAPQFVYRTELGDDWTVDGAMTQYELASALSYFLTDDAPDPMLSDAAAQGQLSTPEQVAAHVDRILETPTARQNLTDAMTSYFNYQGLENVVIQDMDFNSAVANSMYHEGELFLQNTLWGGTLSDLLLSRQSVINELLAGIYGIAPFPPPGVTLDEDGFALVTLPEVRSGLVTMPGFLSTRSRPTETSVVGRGLLIKNAFLCTDTPPPPESIGETIAELAVQQKDETEREKSAYRQTTPPCNGCHATFDAYGVALENYDLIGRYRETDDAGRVIDSSVTLPYQIGGGDAANMVEVAQKIAETSVFAKCMGRNLVNYALADTSAGAAQINDCSSQHVADAFTADPAQTFSSLVKSVATSATFATRSQGAAQ